MLFYCYNLKKLIVLNFHIRDFWNIWIVMWCCLYYPVCSQGIETFECEVCDPCALRGLKHLSVKCVKLWRCHHRVIRLKIRAYIEYGKYYRLQRECGTYIWGHDNQTISSPYPYLRDSASNSAILAPQASLPWRAKKPAVQDRHRSGRYGASVRTVYMIYAHLGRLGVMASNAPCGHIPPYSYSGGRL